MASTDSDQFDQLRQNATVAMQTSLTALQALQSDLANHAEISSALIAGVSAGQPLPDILLRINSPEVRPALTSTIRAFERARHRARLRLIAVALAEGASDQDIRQLWSLSQEMVRRAKREITEIDDVELPEDAEESS